MLALAFLGLAVAGVLLLGPMDTRIRTKNQVESVDGTGSLIAVCQEHSVWPLAAAIRGLRQRSVFLVPVGDSEIDQLAQEISGSLASSGTDIDVTVSRLSDTPTGLLSSSYPIVLVIRVGIDRRADLVEAYEALTRAGRIPAGVAVIAANDGDRALLHA